MLTTAIFLFVIAAIFGAIALMAILRRKTTPKLAVFLHGSIVAFAVLLIICYMILYGTSTLLTTSLILFILAALGGLTMLSIDLKNKPVPKAIALLHPLVAIAGLIVLIVYVFR